MSTKDSPKKEKFQFAGWILFVFSAIFFIASSLRAGDWLSLTGGILFLLACFVFLIPLVFPKQLAEGANPQNPDAEKSKRN